MDLFPDGAFVRLRSRARGRYVHADEDATWVSLRPLGAAPSLNSVWRAEHWPDDDAEGGAYLLLQGAAYGRYLAVSTQPAPPGHLGFRAAQRDYDSAFLEDPFLWRPHRVDAGQNYARLRNNNRCLRANGRRRFWNNVVTVDVRDGSLTTMMQWRVEAIPVSPDPLPLPPPPGPPPPIHASRGLFGRRTQPGVHPHPGRRIRHLQVNEAADFNLDHGDWSEFDFYDHSVFNLWTELGLRHHEDEGITLCVRAGLNAFIIPLVTDLPRNVDPMDIVVVPNGSPAAAMLVYPQFDAPDP